MLGTQTLRGRIGGLVKILVTGAATAVGAQAAPAPLLVAHWDAQAVTGEALPDLSGRGHDGRLVGVTAMRKVEDLVERPYLAFDGVAAHALVPHQAGLNLPQLTVVAWVNVPPGSIEDQKPLLVKSLPAHQPPWYEYGLFLMDRGEAPCSLSLYLSVGGALQMAVASDVVVYDTWQCLAGTYDGATLRLFRDGVEVAASAASVPGPVDPSDQPLLLGAYGNLPKEGTYCFGGAMASVRLYAGPLSGEALRALYEAERGAFPAAALRVEGQASEYARGLNEALRQGRDVWGEKLMAEGGATYEGMKDLLRPLFFSTGDTYQTLGVHNLVFAEDNGAPPFVIPLADGSRIAATRYDAPRRLTVFVGAEGEEPFGADLDRLAGPTLDGGWYPILQTVYTDGTGAVIRQESFAGRVPGLGHLAAFVRFGVTPAAEHGARLTLVFGQTPRQGLRCEPAPEWDGERASFRVPAGAGERLIHLLWSPGDNLPEGTVGDAATYDAARDAWRAYWERTLAAGATFEVPEAVAMDALRNVLVQNLMMRWRYTLGPVVYHGDFYQPESSDAMTTLALYGYTEACRAGLGELLGKSKGPDSYSNWETGEKLTHGALYYHLTGDRSFIEEHSPVYAQLCQGLAEQVASDPHGLLHKQRHCGDIPAKSYCTFHQTVCWRGLRDLAEIWRRCGREEEANRFAPVAASLRTAIRKAVEAGSTRLPDGSLFVPTVLYERTPVFSPITATRLGSYWNLCMPYAFSSGFWDPGGAEMGAILDFLHGHGATLLGLLRFNYYPVAIGSHRPKGLPGYATTGFDNVYLPGYLRMLADHDQADRLVLSFYGKLAHGQTRGTFVNGEGETVGEVPGERYRSCYGTPNSGNNTGYLLALRLLLVRESFDGETGLPSGLFLADAIPRPWLAAGQTIAVRAAPTCFGPLSYTLTSQRTADRIEAVVQVPEREPIRALRLKLRLPDGRRLRAVTVNGQQHTRFDADSETIDLTGLGGRLEISARCE
jgi:hypothetical protein